MYTFLEDNFVIQHKYINFHLKSRETKMATHPTFPLPQISPNHQIQTTSIHTSQYALTLNTSIQTQKQAKEEGLTIMIEYTFI